MWNVYDFMFYAGKPDLTNLGIKKGKMYWEAQFFSGSDHSAVPTPAALAAVGANALSLGLPAGTPYCIDIEVWRSYTVGAGDTISMADAKIAIQKYVDTIRSVKQAAPGLEFGFFGAVLPMEDGFYAVTKSIDHSDIRGAAYQKLVLQRKIAAESDILFPSCYAYTHNSAEWRKSFKLQIEMCKLLSPTCKIIPFVWPQIPPVVPTMANQFLPVELWREILDSCYEMADGVAIYAEQTTPWTTATANYWWPETQRFLIDKKLLTA